MRTAIVIVLSLVVAAWAIPAFADSPDTPEKAVKPTDQKAPKKFKPGEEPKKEDPKKDDGKGHKFGAPTKAGAGPAHPVEKKFPEWEYMGSIGLYIPLVYPDDSHNAGTSTVSRYDAFLDVLTFVYRWRQDSGIRLALADAGGLFYSKENCTGACIQNLIFNGFQIGYERFFGHSDTFVPSAYLTIGPALVVENFSIPVEGNTTTWDYRWGFAGELGGIARWRMKNTEWAPFLQAKLNYFGYSGVAGTSLFGFGIGLGMEHTF